MKSSLTIARIDALRRYISLLREGEKRLGWVIASSTASQRTDAERDFNAISEKLRKAEKELSELEKKQD